MISFFTLLVLAARVDECHAVYALLRDPETQIVLPCEAKAGLPRDPYRTWIERGDMISRQQREGAELVAAARIALDQLIAKDKGVRFINFSEGFVRPVAGDQAAILVRIPPGRIGGAIVERKTGDAVALIRAVDVAAGTVARRSAEGAPKGRSGVYLEMALPKEKKGVLEKFALSIDGHLRLADEFVDAGSRVYALWFDVDGRSASLIVRGANVRYAGRDIVLRPGKITSIRGELPLKPSLDVTVNVVASNVPAMFVDVGERRVPAKNHETTRIESLDAAPVRVFLEIPPWKIARIADLSDGRDALVGYDITPIEVSGVVHYGNDRSKAKIGFMDHDGWIDIETDDDGAYHTVLWSPRDYVTRVLPSGVSSPFIQLVRIDESGTYDLDVPRSRYVVRVRNAATGTPIASASVQMENTWTTEERGKENVGLKISADDKGEAVLPPLRPGTISVLAEAKGFQRSKPQQESVNNDAERTIEIALDPITETTSLKLTLGDGSPADGAELMATNNDDVIWRGSSDRDGSVDVPRSALGALLLIRHPRGGSIARVWDGRESLQLPAAAPAITIQTDDMHAAQLSVIIDGMRMSGIRLAFLASSTAGTDRDGLWNARNLPCAPLRLIAWKKVGPVAIASGAYDALATAVPCPSPNRIVLRPID